jgi:pyruvate,water dikinase
MKSTWLAPVPPVPVPVEVPDGYWQRDDSHAPKPNSPLYSSVAMPNLNRAGKAWFAEYGFLMDGLEWREIGGWQYISIRPLGGKERKPPPPWLWPILVRLVPPLRRRIRSCVEAVRSDRANRNLEQWFREWKPDLRSRAEALLEAPLAELSDAELDRHLDAASRLGGEAARIHFVLHGAVSLHLGELVFTCRDLLGWDDMETLEVLGGLSGTSTEPAAELASLARQARTNPGVLGLLEDGVVDLDRYVEVDADFAVAFDGYRRSYGHRALRYEVVDPTLNETPELLIQLLRDQISAGFDPGHSAEAVRAVAEEKLAQARSMLAGRAGDLARFERVLARAERAYPVREDNEFFTVSLPLGVARQAFLELGRRLADRGQIAARDDVFFLTFDEARRALSSRSDQHYLVQRRKGERAWIEAHPGPGSYGEDPGPPPSFAALPNEARFAMEALLWFVDRAFETERSSRTQGAGPIDGVAASPGRYRGPVRVVSDETEFAKIQPGDVLVCPVTSPVWSVLFPSIGALVTDTGGILSHPAIIAREYRIPAVVATGNATDILSDGQVVTVDGTAGVVEVDGAGE